jgi:hypothetical protein
MDAGGIQAHELQVMSQADPLWITMGITRSVKKPCTPFRANSHQKKHIASAYRSVMIVKYDEP